MKRLIGLFIVGAFFINSNAQLTISKISTAPTIDALGSDWGGSSWINIGKRNSGSTTDDMVGKFQLTYDDKNLYVIVQVTDATPNYDSTAIMNYWERDHVSIYFDMDTDTYENGKYHEGVWELRMQRGLFGKDLMGNNGTVGGGDIWNFNALKYSPNFKAAASGSADPYIVEMQLPWDSLTYQLGKNGIRAWDGKQFKFDIGINDNTTGEAGGRTEMKFWNDESDQQWHSTSNFGLVKLQSPVTIISDTRLNQYIYFAAIPSVKLGAADLEISAYASSGLSLKYVSSNTSVATIVNNKIHVVGVGTCKISANQTGNSTYKPALSVYQTLVVTSGGSSNSNLVINKVATPPTLDADPSDWGGAWINITKRNPASTTSDMSAKFQMTYDDKNLYIITEIFDMTPNYDTTSIMNIYERDVVELYLSMDTITYENNYYHEGCWQIWVPRNKEYINNNTLIQGNNGKIGGGDSWNVDLLKNSPAFKAISSGPTNPYYVEVQLPWDILTYQMKDGIPAWDKKFFKFDIGIADNTTGMAGGRTDHIFWNNNSDEQWHNTSKFGLVSLDGGIVDNPTEAQLRARIKELEDIIANGEITIFDTIFVSFIDLQEFNGIVNLIEGNVNVRIYPNPAHKLVSLELSDVIYQYEIYNLEGRLMRYADVGQMTTTIDVSKLASGNYVLKIVTPKGTISSKMVIRK